MYVHIYMYIHTYTRIDLPREISSNAALLLSPCSSSLLHPRPDGVLLHPRLGPDDAVLRGQGQVRERGAHQVGVAGGRLVPRGTGRGPSERMPLPGCQVCGYLKGAVGERGSPLSRPDGFFIPGVRPVLGALWVGGWGGGWGFESYQKKGAKTCEGHSHHIITCTITLSLADPQPPPPPRRRGLIDWFLEE